MRLLDSTVGRWSRCGENDGERISVAWFHHIPPPLLSPLTAPPSAPYSTVCSWSIAASLPRAPVLCKSHFANSSPSLSSAETEESLSLTRLVQSINFGESGPVHRPENLPFVMSQRLSNFPMAVNWLISMDGCSRSVFLLFPKTQCTTKH